MNKRIEKLNRLALGEVLNGQDPDNDIDKMYIPAQFTKKFAELIVRECLGIINKEHDEGIDRHCDYQLALYEAYREIKEHFGVEE